MPRDLRGIGALALTLLVACQNPQLAEPTFTPVAGIGALMEWLIEPAADVVWGAAGTIITADGITELRPKDEDEWIRVEANAMLVVEGANLLMIPPRALDEAQWIEMTRALVDGGQAVLEAARARDVEQLFETGAVMYEACAACHEQYSPDVR